MINGRFAAIADGRTGNQQKPDAAINLSIASPTLKCCVFGNDVESAVISDSC